MTSCEKAAAEYNDMARKLKERMQQKAGRR
jgi:hypothetical protein